MIAIDRAYAKLNAWLANVSGAEMNGAWGYASVPSNGGKALQCLLAWGAKYSEVCEMPAADQEEMAFWGQPGRYAQIEIPLRRVRFNQLGGWFEALEHANGRLEIVCGG